MESKIQNTKKLIGDISGYNFHDDAIVLEAIDASGGRITHSNQRLALLGDKIMAFVVIDLWYPTHESKGAADKTLQEVCGNDNLAAVARNIGLEALIIMNPGHYRSIGRNVLATTMEAIIAAVYLDSGKDSEAVKNVMLAMGLALQAPYLDSRTYLTVGANISAHATNNKSPAQVWGLKYRERHLRLIQVTDDKLHATSAPRTRYDG